ncbi:MAG: hypothetical protein AVDCRST_MAG66-3572 [uncultured Pseudonocardia sp.]|uniref:Uncharacterized protein n=1 Tax=uncultured Pseudonocardia sp. TaxID=211455 RepID=A0A6J4Q7D0_9PSEU|nr:MAG: hypothetical protein AVDCRST_MAG66-3572 [uncultured Pseudonocardia sp.]
MNFPIRGIWPTPAPSTNGHCRSPRPPSALTALRQGPYEFAALCCAPRFATPRLELPDPPRTLDARRGASAQGRDLHRPRGRVWHRRANAQLKSWKILRRIRCCPHRATHLVKTVLVLILAG